MIPFLVRVRIPATSGLPAAIAMYVAMFHTEAAAQKAVEEAVPEDWQVAVVGQLGSAAVERRNLKTGDILRLE
jgi:hypothetical protein